MRQMMVDLVRVPWDACILFARHWPTLITLCLGALAARQALLWLSVSASDVNSTLGVLLLPLASLSMMVGIVFMLRTLRPSMDALTTPESTVPVYKEVVAVLLPFLAVYASQGLLREDSVGFRYDATRAERLSTFETSDFSRVLIADGWLLVALVLTALIVRKLIICFELTKRHWGWGVLAVYVEALWMVTLGVVFTKQVQAWLTWVQTRQAWAWWIDLRDWALGLTGWIGTLFQATLGAIGGVLNAAGSLVVVPVAWLSVGALIYGTKLAEEKKAAAAPQEAPQSRRDYVLRQAQERARAAAADVVSPVVDPVQKAWRALQKIAVAGIGPMVLFCLVFALAQQSSVLMAELTRWLVGPRPSELAEALEPYHVLAQRLVYFVVMTVLLAAAINRVVGALNRSAQLDAEVVGVPR